MPDTFSHPSICHYRARHTVDRVPAVTTIDCGPVLGPTPACQECVDVRDEEVRATLRAAMSKTTEEDQ